jgi:hypothetical protein
MRLSVAMPPMNARESVVIELSCTAQAAIKIGNGLVKASQAKLFLRTAGFEIGSSAPHLGR